MPWPKIDSLNAWDLWRGNDPVDLKTALVLNPNIELIITRLAGGNSGADPSYPENYDDTLAAGRKVACYPVINPKQPRADMFELWKNHLGTRIPKAFWWDCELDYGLPASTVTSYTRDVLKQAQDTWPDSNHGIYTGSWWWDDHIVHGWEHAFDLWAAHYLWEYMTSSTAGAQYKDFKNLMAKLPIGNSFTPLVPKGWKEAGKQPAIWQFSDQGVQDGVYGKVDLNFVAVSWMQKVYGQPEQPPIVVPPPVVAVRFAKGTVVLKVEEV